MSTELTLFSGSCYLANKILRNFANAPPEEGAAKSSIWKSQFLQIKEHLVSYLGPNASKAADILMDNAWISILVLSYLPQNPPINNLKKLKFYSHMIICLSGLTHLTRFGLVNLLAKVNSQAAMHIAPHSWKKPSHPTPIEEDPFLKNYLCTISGTIPKIPISDPDNEKIIYDLMHLLSWLIRSNTSPLTRKPFPFISLKENDAIKIIIQSRFAYLHKQTRNLNG